MSAQSKLVSERFWVEATSFSNLRSPAASMSMSRNLVTFSQRMLNRSILCFPHARFSIVGIRLNLLTQARTGSGRAVYDGYLPISYGDDRGHVGLPNHSH